MAWLGEEQEDTHLAFELLEQLIAAQRHLFDLSQTSSNDNDISPVFHLISEVLDEKYWVALRGLFSLPYWNRIWVVQEAILGNLTELCCGEQRLFLQYLRLAMMFITKLASTDNAKFLTVTQQVISWSIRFGYIPMLSLMKSVKYWSFFEYPLLLRNMSELQCKDPRDRLYALMGRAELAPPEKRVHIQPDYSQPVRTVYLKFATDWLRSTQDVSLIAFGGTGMPADEARLHLPSWVPQPGSMRCVNSAGHSHNASNSIAPPSYDLTADGHGLQLRAVLCDTITDSKSPEFDDDDILHVGRTISNFFGLLQKSDDWLYCAHPTRLPWLQVFFRNLIRDNSGSSHNGRPDFRSAEKEADFFDCAAGFCDVLRQEFKRLTTQR